MPIYKSLSEKEITHLMEEFGIENIESSTKLSGGWANSNYQVNTKDISYVLTVCETNTVTATQQLIQILDHLASHNFRSSVCFPTKSGKYITYWNDKPVILKSFIKGKMCTSLNNSLAFQLGEKMGALHLIPSLSILPQIHGYGKEEFSRFREEYAKRHSFLDWLKDMEKYIHPFLSDTLPTCMIHGDIFKDNLILDSDGSLVIMDFEECCHYYRVYDLGMTIVGTCFVDGQLQIDLMKNLIDGYRSKVSLTEEEEEAVIPFAVYAASSTALWRFRQFNVLFPNEKLKNHYLEMCNFAEILQGVK